MGLLTFFSSHKLPGDANNTGQQMTLAISKALEEERKGWGAGPGKKMPDDLGNKHRNESKRIGDHNMQ